MRLVIALASLAGCGRINFDALDDASSMPVSDGARDASGVACTPFDTTVDIAASGGYAFPAAAWTGSQYLLVIEKNNSWSVLPVGADGSAGTVVDNVVPAGDLIGQGPSGAVWTGAKLGIISVAGNSIQLRTYDPSSGTVAGPFTVNTTSASWLGEALTWAGDRFLVAWSTGSATYMREMDAAGMPLTAELLVSGSVGNVYSVVASPTRYVAGALNGTSQPYVVVVDRSSLAPTTTMIDSPNTVETVVVVRSDGTFGATTDFFMTGKLQLLSTTGVPTMSVTFPVSDAGGLQNTLQPTPTGFRITTLSVGSATHMLQRVDLDPAGAIIGSPTPLGSFTSNGVSSPSSLFAGDRSLFAFPFDVLASPYHMRLIQSCP